MPRIGWTVWGPRGLGRGEVKVRPERAKRPRYQNRLAKYEPVGMRRTLRGIDKRTKQVNTRIAHLKAEEADARRAVAEAKKRHNAGEAAAIREVAESTKSEIARSKRTLGALTAAEKKWRGYQAHHEANYEPRAKTFAQQRKKGKGHVSELQRQQFREDVLGQRKAVRSNPRACSICHEVGHDKRRHQNKAP